MNYKIRVENEAESKEVKGLFVVLGYMVVNNIDCEKGYIVASKNAESPINFDYWHDVKNIITIQELHDLVVLKRNDVGDATHGNAMYPYVKLSDGWYYFDESGKWLRSTGGQPSYYENLKPIEKKEIKEYLNKLTDGTYKLVVLSDVIDGHDGLIEIPEGAEVATSLKFVIGAVSFLKRINDSFLLWSEQDGEWGSKKYKTITKAVGDNKVLWQRHTQPEELPFVDDEPSLNDQYAEIEQVRKEYKLKNDMSVDDYIDTLRCEDTVNHPSHYAGEIECIDAMEAMLTPEQFIGYLRGNSFKYMWRYENKGGITDLEKAQWYLNKLISRIG